MLVELAFLAEDHVIRKEPPRALADLRELPIQLLIADLRWIDQVSGLLLIVQHFGVSEVCLDVLLQVLPVRLELDDALEVEFG